MRDGSLSGDELENQLGDTNTVFGRASRKAQLSVLETELELSARKQISEIMTNAITNDIGADELADDLDGVTLAYSKLAFDAHKLNKMFLRFTRPRENWCGRRYILFLRRPKT